ncbi:MAG: hypothetical protein JWR24_745 [Actinoallomurus sp.]|nr:hypothetical protein [Actinoallomurus sp.]
MRLKKASLAFAGAAAAVAVTTMAASPAWACNDKDPGLKLDSICSAAGLPTWTVSNPNGWGSVPFTWVDNKGGRSQGKILAPANGSVTLPTHAPKVFVVAYRPDQGHSLKDFPVWKNHGTAGKLHCKAPKPPTTMPSTPPTTTPSTPPTTTTPKPAPSLSVPPSGQAAPATPVKAQPQFTG